MTTDPEKSRHGASRGGQTTTEKRKVGKAKEELISPRMIGSSHGKVPPGIPTVADDVAAADDADAVSSREPRRLEILEHAGHPTDHHASAP